MGEDERQYLTVQKPRQSCAFLWNSWLLFVVLTTLTTEGAQRAEKSHREEKGRLLRRPKQN